jgi:hypothetical protein
MNGLLRREVLIPLLVVLLGGGAYVTKPWADAPARAARGLRPRVSPHRAADRSPTYGSTCSRRLAATPQRVSQSVPLPGEGGASCGNGSPTAAGPTRIRGASGAHGPAATAADYPALHRCD